MKSVRRRNQLVQLDSPTTNEEFTLYGDQQEDSGVFLESAPSDVSSSHYVSPCEFRVSNDPLVVQEDNDCDATIYGCARDHTFLITTDEDVKEVDLRYYYDLYYEYDSSATNIQDIVGFLEGTMLEHLASILEIKQCPPGGGDDDGGGNNAVAAKRGPQRNRRRGLSIPTPNVQKKENGRMRSLMEEFTNEQKSVFIAINSDPRDVPADEDYGCLASPEEGIQCQSMNGFMKLYLEDARVTEEDTVNISEAVLTVLEGGMKGNVYSKGAIKSLVFRGATPPVVVSPESTAIANTTAATSVSTEDNPSPLLPAIPIAALPSSVDSATNNGDPFGETVIGVIVGASSFVLLLSILALFLLARRQKVESTSNTTTTTNNQGNNNKEMQTDEGSSMRSISMRSRSSQRRPRSSPPTKRRSSLKKIGPSLEPQRSLEGAEIPGSLAAMDALALKPQIQRNEQGGGTDDDHFFSVEDCSSAPPLTPPRVSRTRVESPQQTTTATSSRGGVEKSRSPLHVPDDVEEEDDSTDDEGRPLPPPAFLAAGSLSPVPLSPVRNRRSGVSPSRVSPKRLPSPFNEPFVSSRRNHDQGKENPTLYSPASLRKPSLEVLRSDDQSGVSTKKTVGSITTLGLILDGSMSSDTHSDLISAKGGRGRTRFPNSTNL